MSVHAVVYHKGDDREHKPATCNFLPSCYKFDRATLQRLHELCKTFQNKSAGSFWEVLFLNLRVLRV